jgi:hypothetical protein
MNLSAAAAGGLAGVVVGAWGYAALAAAAALLAATVLAAGLGARWAR